MKIHLWLLFGPMVMAGVQAGSVPAEVVPSGVPQLFVDDVWIIRKSGIVRTIHPCRKLKRPVIEPDRLWEGHRIYVYGSVCWDATARQFRMWYMSAPTEGTLDPTLTRGRHTLVLYATSGDGVHWTKPNLGLYEFNGSKDNNIVYDLDSPSVIVNESAADSKRYTMLGYGRHKDQKPGGWVSSSADGLHWQDYPVNPVFRTSDTLTLARDPYRGEYLAFHKINETIRGYPRRLVGLTTSKDLQTWSASKLVMVPDEKDDSWAKSPDQRTEFYDMSAFPYGGQFLGLVAVFRKTRRLESAAPAQSRDDGPIHAELVHSRDGRLWHRLGERRAIIPNGPSSFDAGCILGMANTPVIRNDEIWVYYTGITTTHGGAMPAKRITIGRAAWRLDGFVSLDAGPDGGVVETVPLELAGSLLTVNADVREGELRVGVLDDQGGTLPGYAVKDCTLIRGDSVRHPVRWKGRDTLPTDRPIRLVFDLKRGSLFSFMGHREGEP